MRVGFPPDKSYDITDSVTLSWERSQADSDVRLSYKIYLSEDYAKWRMVKTQEETSLTLTQGYDTPGATYYWKVETIGSNNLKATSPTFSFTIESGKYYQDGEVKRHNINGFR